MKCSGKSEVRLEYTIQVNLNVCGQQQLLVEVTWRSGYRRKVLGMGKGSMHNMRSGFEVEDKKYICMFAFNYTAQSSVGACATQERARKKGQHAPLRESTSLTSLGRPTPGGRTKGRVQML